MEYSIEKGKKSVVNLTMSFNGEEWKEALKASYDKVKGSYALPGFRKGKVPMNLLAKTYGIEIFFEEAIYYSFNKNYYSVLEKEDWVKPIDRPDLDVKDIKEDSCSIIAIIPVMPEVKLGEYKGIKIDKIEYNVKDEEVEAELKRYAEKYTREVEVTDRACKDGDITNINYSGSVDGVKFEGGTAENQNLTLGSKTFIPGFEEQVIGMNIGEEKDIEVTFPEEYHEKSLAGKKAIFAVKLNSITEKQVPALDDELIKEGTEFNTVEEYRKDVVEKMQKRNENRAKMETEDAIIKKIIENSEFEVPEALVERQIDNMVEDMERRMAMQGLKLEMYLKYMNMSIEDYRKNFKAEAERHVNYQIIIEELIKAEKFEASEEEINKKIEDMANAQNKPVEEFTKTVNAQMKEYFKNQVITDKLFDFLLSNNQIG